MKKAVMLLAAVCGSVSLGGCATILDGTTQEITVNTNPSGAECVFTRQDREIARISTTPAATNIRKSKYDITIICNKPGYQTATYLNKSGNAAATVGNLALGGLIGWGVDSATGSDNKYDSPVNITLVPSYTPPPPAVTQPAPATPATTPIN